MCICKMPFCDTYLNVLDLCRLCLATDNSLIPVFDSSLISDQLCDKINVCLDVQLKTDDQVSQKICDGCLTKVNSFYDFRSQTSESQKVLKNWFNRNCENLLSARIIEDSDAYTEETKSETAQTTKTEHVNEINDNLKTEQCLFEGSDNSDIDSNSDSGSGCDSSDSDTEETDESNNSKEHNSLNSPDCSGISNNVSVESGIAGPSSTCVNNEKSSIKLQEAFSNVLESKNEEKNNKYCLPKTGEIVLADKVDCDSKILETHFGNQSAKVRTEVVDQSLLRLDIKKYKKYSNKEEAKKKFECNICQFTAKYKSQLDIHIKRHKKDYKVFCDICHKGFFYQNEIEMHKALHEETNRFECSICQKKFVYRHSLVSHFQKHADIPKPKVFFQCDECGKEFSDKSYLKRHKDLHTGAKKVICEVCGQLLSNPGSLRSHSLTHTGERPFGCASCGKSFTTKKYLMIHKRTHTGAKPFVCQTCGKSFSQQSSLIVHKRYHSGERPYQCQMCNKAFVTKTILKIHQKNHSI